MHGIFHSFFQIRFRKISSRILLAALAIGITGVFAGSILLYNEVRKALSLVKPAATALLEDRTGTFLSESAGHHLQELGYWDIPQSIPERIEAAFLITEDRRFYEHPGIDGRAILRALWKNMTTAQRQGASTIAMQVARMQRDLPADGSYRRTYWQKLCESITALLLIRKFGHQAVLRHYLTLVPQGNRIHGVAYAARRYFQKPLQDLSWAEVAVLAALPKAPGKMNLFRPEGQTRAFARADRILEVLHTSGILDTPDFLAAIRHLTHLTIPTREIRPEHSYHAILRLEEWLREHGVQQYGHPMRASLDLRIQENVARIASATMEHYRALGAGNIAVMVVETATGKVAAYLGSDGYYNADYAGAINYARVPRSSGSTLKPFIFALGLERNLFSPASLLSDMPILVALPYGYHRIGNYDGQNLGHLLYRKALANSRNVPAVHVLSRVGIEHAYELFRQLGLTNHARPAEYYGIGMAIGTLYVTLEDLITAYGVLANEGRAFRLQWFESLPEDSLHKPPLTNQEQILDPQVARQISLFLSDPLARLPTFSRMGPLEYPFPVAVKTGTSQGFRDAWAVAYSGKYLVGAWIGHPENTRMRGVAGITVAQVVKQIILDLHPEERRGVAEHPFAPPEGFTLVNICAATGSPTTDQCPEVFPEYFRPGTQPFRSTPATYTTASIQTGTESTLSDTDTPAPALHMFSTMRSPFSFDKLLNASVAIREPAPGAVFVLDPDTPRGAQTLPFQAIVSPNIANIVWYVNGEPFDTAPYPYTVRWPLRPGKHSIQARFAHADIASDIVTITVY